MHIKSASSLIFAHAEGQIVGYNFLQKKTFECTPELFNVLHDFETWQDVEEGDEETELAAMVEVGALISGDAPESSAEDEFLSQWKWGIPAAMLHHSVQGNDYLTSAEIEEKQIETASHTKSPPLYLTNDGLKSISLDRPLPCRNDVLSLMAQRRSVREVTDRAVALSDLGDILFSGLGITGFTKNCVGELPLKMTPSGGARNPYEGYVIARNVEGLEPGVYHYSALEHSLGLLKAPAPEAMGDLVAGQDWVSGMACVIILSAFMDRPMWKYDDPNAYRVMLIEAGHIGQNMMLTGTEKGMTVCPSAALCHEPLFDLLELPSRITCAPIYALAVGYPNPDYAG
jgi:SagB-type dehydrogenase family enzyme